MLVLCRHIGESIKINGGEITVTVLRIHGDKVRIGITAPLEISIHREEIQDEIDREAESIKWDGLDDRVPPDVNIITGEIDDPSL